METVTIGMAGAGRAFSLHMEALRYVHGINVRHRAVFGRRIEQVEWAKKEYGFEKAVYRFEDLINDREIDVIHIVTPPCCHENMILRALKAGKHVICEKPLMVFFDSEVHGPVGFTSKAHMYNHVLRRLETVKAVVQESGKRLMYAENMVYAPNILRASELIAAKKSRILFMKGEESLKGSSSVFAGQWSKTGGGTFSRNGAHPLAAILWLKQQEGRARGEEIVVTSVMADMGRVTPYLTEFEHRHIDIRPIDTEDIGTAILQFSDGSRAVIMATNVYLGGLRDYVELYCNDAVYKCKLTLGDAMHTYFLDENGMEHMKLSEFLSSKLGWNSASVADEVLRGYVGEMQDFMESVSGGREPVSGIDLATETIKVIYGAYLSAEQGCPVKLKKG